MRSCARSVIRATRSQCGVPQLALRAYPDDALEDRGGALPRFVERGYPTKAIITIPMTLYEYGNGDDAEEGGSRESAMGGNMGKKRHAPAASSCSVSLTTRTGSSSSLCRSVSARRSLGGERAHGLYPVSPFYTTLVKKSQQANRASELRERHFHALG